MDKIRVHGERVERNEVWIAELVSKVNELVEENNELKRRLDNHISKHKEYAEGGDPCPNESSDI